MQEKEKIRLFRLYLIELLIEDFIDLETTISMMIQFKSELALELCQN